MQIHTIEYVDKKTRWYITIGNKAPWDNLHIRMPKIIARLFCK